MSRHALLAEGDTVCVLERASTLLVLSQGTGTSYPAEGSRENLV
jgi:hypothetical protein